MIRCFIGIFVPENLKKSILKIQEKIRDFPIDCKFVKKENLHISLSFLGEKDKKELDELKYKMNILCKNFKKFNIKICKLKPIPNEKYIRVIAFNIIDKNNLLEISKQIKKQIGGDVKPPHLTICRVKRVYDKKNTVNKLKKINNSEIGTFVVEKICLIKSILERSGPKYTIIHSCFLE